MILLGVLLLWLAGLAMILYGWFGPRRDHYTYCRYCNDNLAGSGDDPAECPECGQSLRYPIAIGSLVRRARRRRRIPAILFGLMLIASPLALSGIWILVNSYASTGIAMPPQPMPVQTAATDDAVWHALGEQLRNGQLSRYEIEQLTEAAIHRLKNQEIARTDLTIHDLSDPANQVRNTQALIDAWGEHYPMMWHVRIAADRSRVVITHPVGTVGTNNVSLFPLSVAAVSNPRLALDEQIVPLGAPNQQGATSFACSIPAGLASSWIEDSQDIELRFDVTYTSTHDPPLTTTQNVRRDLLAYPHP